MRVPCNFCEFSSSSSEQDQDNEEEAVLRKEVERLQFLIKRMTGRDDDASFTELQAHETRLKDLRRIVLAQTEKIKLEEDERKKEAAGARRGKSSTSSSEERQEKQETRWARNWKRPISESLQSKFERLRLFNERMNGKEIENMTSYHDLLLLDSQIIHSLICLSEQMVRPLLLSAWQSKEMKMKRKRRDLTKNVRVLCDFCGLSSSNRCEQSPYKQEDESLSMESEFKRLQLLTRRMTGKDTDGLSFTELQLLETKLEKNLLIVKKQKEKTELEEAERLREQEKRKQSLRPRPLKQEKEKPLPRRLKQKMEAGDKDEATMTSSGEKRDDEAPSKSRKERLRAKSIQRQQIEYEKLRAEPMQSQLERLWLLNERMSGRELGNMTSSGLHEVLIQLQHGLIKLSSTLPI